MIGIKLAEYLKPYQKRRFGFSADDARRLEPKPELLDLVVGALRERVQPGVSLAGIVMEGLARQGAEFEQSLIDALWGCVGGPESRVTESALRTLGALRMPDFDSHREKYTVALASEEAHVRQAAIECATLETIKREINAFLFFKDDQHIMEAGMSQPARYVLRDLALARLGEAFAQDLRGNELVNYVEGHGQFTIGSGKVSLGILLATNRMARAKTCLLAHFSVKLRSRLLATNGLGKLARCGPDDRRSLTIRMPSPGSIDSSGVRLPHPSGCFQQFAGKGFPLAWSAISLRSVISAALRFTAKVVLANDCTRYSSFFQPQATLIKRLAGATGPAMLNDRMTALPGMVNGRIQGPGHFRHSPCLGVNEVVVVAGASCPRGRAGQGIRGQDAPATPEPPATFIHTPAFPWLATAPRRC